MSNLSKDLREALSSHYKLNSLTEDHRETSVDGTVKLRLRTQEGYFLESVYIPTPTRRTLCVSSQVGCSLSCRFCATATMERKRNLFFDEIWDQYRFGNALALEESGEPLTNIVFMGMGEPLLNYDEVIVAIDLITYPTNFYFRGESRKTEPKRHREHLVVNKNQVTPHFSPKRITVSTAGITKGIRQLAEDQVKFELALSLHAADDDKRSQIMMNNPQNNLSHLRDSLCYFYEQTNNKITLEYLLLKGFNDSPKDAQNLIRFYHAVPAELVNIIEYNPVPGISFRKPGEEVFGRFVGALQNGAVNVHVRHSRGRDIAAACGQLANQTSPSV